ncbi:unnamed protein product [Allacma fusca]|uniref:C2H2-type domain-containing protein n=1 Tax=Allacma fusca TaxID=39272 RepID=A0A8J2L9V3_9HEXA|nr:unnamed protein product [Allacma fusca]
MEEFSIDEDAYGGKGGLMKNKQKIFKTEADGNYLEKTEEKLNVKIQIVKKDLTGETGIKKNPNGSRCLKSPEELYNTQIRRKLKHLQVHYTKDHPFRCNECSYSSNKSSNLSQHMRTHTGEKPFRCSQCPYRGSTRSNLNQHLRTHSGEKPFRCCECPYSGSSRGNLNQHMRKHTREVPFKCEYCPTAFRFQSGLNLHRTKHTGERLYRCEFCDYSGNQSSTFRVHMKGHNTKKKFKCSFCPFWSSRTPVISNHEIRDHTSQARVSSVSRREISKTKVSKVKLATLKVILPVLNGRGDLIHDNHREFHYVKSELFNFREFKIDFQFVNNNFHKCDIKLRVLPDVLISGGANLRGKHFFKTDVQ